MIKLIAKWWASSAATNYMLIGGAAILISGFVYVQELRVKVAKCKSNVDQVERYGDLADLLAKELNKDRDEVISAIENNTSDCLNLNLDDLLRDNEPVVGSGVRGD